MDMKKQSVGFYTTACSAILAIVGLVAYLINCGTDYFSNLGVNPAVVACLVIAVAVQAVYLVVTQKGTPIWTDILPVAASVLLVVATLLFVSVRINGIASIMTFEGNAKTMADLTSAIVGIVGCLAATIVSVAASFFDTTKA